MRLFQEHADIKFDPLLSFNGASFIAGQKVGGLLTAAGSIYAKFGQSQEAAAAPKLYQYQVENLRKDVVHANWMADTITGMTRKIVGGYSQGDDLTRALLVTEAVLSVGQVASAIYIMNMQMHTMELAREIRSFHAGGGSEGIYKDANQRALLTSGTDGKSMLAAQKEFLLANIADDVRTLSGAREALSALEAREQAASDAVVDSYKAAKLNLDAANSLFDAIATKSAEADALRLQLAAAQGDRAEELRAQIATLDKDIADAVAEKNQRLANGDALNRALVDAQKAYKVVEGELDAKQGFVAALTAIEENPHAKYAGYAATSGIVDNGISAVRVGVGLGALATAGSASDDIKAALGLSAVSEAFYGFAAATGKYSSDAAGKFGAFFTGMAAATGMAGSAVYIKAVAGQLDNPHLTAQERTYLEAELALQGTVMALSAIDGALTGLVVAGKSVGQTAIKAIPILSGIASVASAINPARWAEFDAIDARIRDLRPADSATDSLLSEALTDALYQKKAFYGSTAALDMAFGIGASAMAATGVGAPLAIATAVTGAVISGIVRALEQTALEAVADDIRDKMTANGRTVEQFFDLSFDARQNELRSGYEQYFETLLQTDYDAVAGLGSQALSANDLSLAAISKTGGELGKTAKHFADSYTKANGWNGTDIVLSQPAGEPGRVTLADRAGGNVYLTFMSPLMAAGQESTSRTETGKNQFRTSLKISDMAGWTIMDSGLNNTTFNMSKVINQAIDINGKVKDLEVSVKAGAGDDTYFGYEGKIAFDGGSGVDTASYSRLGTEALASGITATATGAVINVDKHLRADSQVYKEYIGSYQETYGKRTETIEYRGIKLVDRGAVTAVRDVVTNVERFHGTDLGDTLDMSASSVVQQIFGFDGDDIISMGAKTNIVVAGGGDDVIKVGAALMDALSKMADGTAQASDAVYIDGGAGLDRMQFDKATHAALREQYAEQQLAVAYAETLSAMLAQGADAQALASQLKGYMLDGAGDDFGLAVFNDVEFLRVDLDVFKAPYHEMSSTEITVAVYDKVPARGYQGIEDWVENHDASRSYVKTNALSDGISSQTLLHYQGQIYLVEGETYEFREVVDDYALFVVEGTTLLANNAWNQHTTATYLADSTGWFDYSLYAQNNWGGSKARLEVRNVNGGQFQVVVGDTDLSQVLGFDSRMLNGKLTGDPALDSIWHASDFQSMIDDVLTAPSGLPYATRNGLVETYAHAAATWSGALDDWAQSHVATTVARAVDKIDGSLATTTLVCYSGEIWMEAGTTYTFRETADDLALLVVGGDTVLSDWRWNAHTTGAYTATTSDWHPYAFYAQNNWGGGGARLEVRAGDMTAFQIIDADMTMSVEMSAQAMNTSVILCADVVSASLIGSTADDSLYGNRGHDLIEGRAGNDVLSGGGGADTFVFSGDFGMDIIIESDASDWIGNTLRFDADFGDIARSRVGDDLILRVDLNNSVTLQNFYTAPSVGQRKTQHLVDRDGDVFTFDQSLVARSAAMPTHWTARSITDYILTYEDRRMLVERDADFAASDRITTAIDAYDSLGALNDGSYQDALLSTITDMFI